MSIIEVVVPDIGGAEGAEVIEILVAVGDEVTLDQGLIVLESDKASMEIPSTEAGVVLELLVSEGDQLAENALIARIEVAGQALEKTEQPAVNEAVVENAIVEKTVVEQPIAEEAPHPSAANAGEKEKASAPAAEAAPSQDQSATVQRAPVDNPNTSGAGVYAGPAVRKLAREFGVDLQQVTGSGSHGRVLKEDVQSFVQRRLQEPTSNNSGTGLPLVAEVDFAKWGHVEVTQRSKMDKLTALNMQRSWLNVPHVTQFDEADITDLEEFRVGLKPEAEKRGTRLTPLPFLLKACAVALRDNPRLNSSLAQGGEELVYKHYIHIGMAVDTPAGLMVPVIRDVDKKTIWELAEEVLSMAAKARDRKLSPADMQGGCFTISSLGNIGGTGFTPIVNTPEVGILGVSKAAMKPVWDGAEFAPRKLLPLTLSYDHRAVNGGDGGRFLSRVVSLLSDIRQLSM